MASTLSLLLLLIVTISLTIVQSFVPTSSSIAMMKTRSSNQISMEYIPEGLSKDQWKELKKREAEELKKKQMGALGTTKFKSRSFEAWQKAGAKHLFPVDPLTTPYEERPYMQRKNGDWEGKDLKGLGLQGKGQGTASKRVNLDNLYDDAASQGKLNSISIFGGIPLPWTNEATAAIKKFDPEGKQGARGVAGKKLSAEELEKLKSKLVKPIITKKDTKAAPEPAPAKKGFFGLF